MNNDEVKYNCENVDKMLAGGTIITVTPLDVGGDELFPVVVIKMPNGTERAMLIQCDPEGNGPGYITLY